ncbi:MAG: cysteine--tRNA ligase [Cyanobacteriota bacterium]|nr:cysteine--tRNA ligase [Cyanobacteriota bacterium]MDY6363651.1 cysteine--tRNA ligase [Cyanobacteriota bacterium]MDY6382591.1 cysteine--tRNA ligase [Cyanobacteriota bacterium]
MQLFNTYSGRLEEFKPIEGNKVKMYVCGPTVYDNAHLGHARCYITWDVLYRYLKFRGYDVTYCRNVTDVDDKILKKAEKEHKTPQEVSQYWYKQFTKSMDKLNNLHPDIEPFATKTIGEMISMIKTLIEKGYAYESNGDVYFRVKRFGKYGSLSGQPIDKLEAGARIAVGEQKEDPLDFALWKKDEKFGYNSPWGVGRPGWHIECSAMNRKYLGKTIDIHAGGADLIFPHHENEIAQSECATGCKFVNYWLHNGFVTIDHEKMSKSLGNFLTIDDILKKYDANTIRLFILTNHYRMPVEFSPEALNSAQAGAKRLTNAKQTPIDESLDITKTPEYKAFCEAMDEDLNTSKALAVLFDLTTRANKGEKDAYTILYKLGTVLGFKFEKAKLSGDELKKAVETVSQALGQEFSTMDEILEYRKKARAEKNWEVADKIRVALDSIGIVLKDTPDGTKIEHK